VSATLLAASVVRCGSFPAAANEACAKVLPAALGLVRSPLMQKQALAALQAFFAALVAAKLPGASFEALLSSLMDATTLGGAGGGAGRGANGGGGRGTAANGGAVQVENPADP
jgi:hypothetical protein